MLVTFISQCEKKALARTRRVLDAFADRIGSNTWQTVMTEDGLIAVKNLLRKTATKNTAVACHWARSRSRSDLVWIIGRRGAFNAEGIVPVNSTKKNILVSDWENNWTYLPLIKALTAVAALLHDWGKATLLFQNKLNPKVKTNPKQGDPLRHEWISCLLLDALVQQSGDLEQDDAWLNLISQGTIDEQAIQQLVAKNQAKPLEKLPPIAQLVAWLILTHHRLPMLADKDKRSLYSGEPRRTIQSLLKSITAEWGYQNKFDEAEFKKNLESCFVFPHGLLSQSDAWTKQVQKWSIRLQQEQGNALTLIQNGAWRVVLHHARLCLMLGDHYYSSCDADPKWQSALNLYANTDKDKKLKQKLDEHLVGVSQQALRVGQMLSRFTTEMDSVQDVRALKQKSPQGYEWQDLAVQKITTFRKHNESLDEKSYGSFIVNMASTGCGKTFANAKIMRAWSSDAQSLRYVLALGLRTLTLQTGDEYRDKIGLDNSELAVLIGSSAVKALHDQGKNNKTDLSEDEENYAEIGSESLEKLLDETVDYDGVMTVDFLEAVIRQEKDKAFLYAPVLACTIDHLMAATETTRGGRYILPCLRLLSSDLVIDEVDDFDGSDLIAIGRLIHLAGMLGRKVMISSATIAPALAEGFFNAYQEGWQLHSQFRAAHNQVACVWVDEFNTQVAMAEGDFASKRYQHYAELHRQFITARVQKLGTQLIKRKGFIADCSDLYAREEGSVKQDDASIEQQYFEKIKHTAMQLHAEHHTVDAKTGKRVSFGVVRVANIPPCIHLAKYLIESDWDSEFSPKIMAYHSRQVLLLRHVQEQHLDAVLKRKEKHGDMPKSLSDPIIREAIDHSAENNVLFILIATPVEEVGRDHDFDWAVVEPSSYRSIIQLAGRVRRHRGSAVVQPNIALMQYNLKALRNDGNPAYCRPGYEGEGRRFKFTHHDLKLLIDETLINEGINAIPRIQQPTSLQPQAQLADLEHYSLTDSLKKYNGVGPETLQAWLASCWWMTALPQAFHRFRASEPTIQLYLVWQDGQPVFCERNDEGWMVKKESVYGIRHEPAAMPMQRLWLHRSYEDALLSQITETALSADEEERMMFKQSKLFGEINIPDRDKDKSFVYSDQFGLLEKKVER